MWIAPEVTDPVLPHAPTRKNIGVIGAVRPADGELVTRLAGQFNSQSIQEFMTQLYAHRRRNCKMVVVMDNATWHHAVCVKASYRRWLKLDYLPAYSPELNPIERVWKMTRRMCTHNRYFPVLEELRESITEQFQRWSQPNPILQRLCAII